MFTGIIEALGSIRQREARGGARRDGARSDGDLRLLIDAATLDLGRAAPGDSIAVNGVCLTAVEFDDAGFAADVSRETLDKTSLGELAAGDPVNLETALTLERALGGHLVSGHVDGLATLLEREPAARSVRFRFEVDPALQRYIAVKGSVTIDGVSLTVNFVDGNRFDVNIVPHTQTQTTFQFYEVGHRVNIEVDLLARYLERLLDGRAESAAERDRRFLQTLIESGFTDDEQAR